MSSDAEFEAADYYSYHRDDEALSHEEPVEAMEEFLDGLTDAEAAELKEVTLYAFARRVVSDNWTSNIAGRMAEQAEEWWRDDYGDPDGDFSFDTDALKASLIGPLNAAVASLSVWACEQVAQKRYTAAEALALCRPLAPACAEGEGEGGA